MPAYDGTIRIDSRLDPKGFNTGIAAITRSVRGLAGVLGLAFGGAAVIGFGKSAVQAASEVSSAMIGLQSIMDGQGRSFTEAKAFINDYINDGLVPLTNAVTAYKNLAMRGYSDEQITQTLTALKNAAAFGRQASLTPGQAVQSATEGLKNENSILVDNAGITKNVSVMWKEYAESIGTTVGMLTKEQKIQAEVNGILAESRFQMGDAAKLAQTYAGQVSALGVSWYNLRAALGSAIIPVLQAIIPYIKTAIDWLVVLINQFAIFMSLLFGVNISMGGVNSQSQDAADATGAIADNTAAAASGAGALADNTKEAGKAAKGALAAFDQLNVLQQETPNSGSGSGGAQPKPPGVVTPEISDGTSVIEDALNDMRVKVAAFKEEMQNLFGPAISAFQRFSEMLSRLGETVWNGYLKPVYEEILKPIGEWAIRRLAPAFLDLLTAALYAINEALIALQPLGAWLLENFLKPLGEWAGTAILDALRWLRDRLFDIGNWIKQNPETFRNFAEVIGILTAAFVIWNTVTAIATVVTGAFAAVMAVSVGTILAVVAGIIFLIGLIVLLVTNWDVVKAAGVDAWEWIKAAWANAGPWFDGVGAKIKTAFGTALDWVKTKWETVFTGVKNFVKNTVNSIIALLNGLIFAVAEAINAVISALNNLEIQIPNWVPFFGGKVWKLNIPPVPTAKIPLLASGAVIPPNSRFLAVLGDQKSGRNIEAPESLIRQIVREETQGMGAREVTINFAGSLGALVRELKPYIDSEDARIGNSLIAGGASA
jgi:hypothetical protein